MHTYTLTYILNCNAVFSKYSVFLVNGPFIIASTLLIGVDNMKNPYNCFHKQCVYFH